MNQWFWTNQRVIRRLGNLEIRLACAREIMLFPAVVAKFGDLSSGRQVENYKVLWLKKLEIQIIFKKKLIRRSWR